MKIATNVLVFQLGSLFVDELLTCLPTFRFCTCGLGLHWTNSYYHTNGWIFLLMDEISNWWFFKVSKLMKSVMSDLGHHGTKSHHHTNGWNFQLVDEVFNWQIQLGSFYLWMKPTSLPLPWGSTSSLGIHGINSHQQINGWVFQLMDEIFQLGCIVDECRLPTWLYCGWTNCQLGSILCVISITLNYE